ncbi:hypothetical protein IQ17_04696 [Bradyrhizobium daqingense]|uniref:Uncharacterized protein n=1 Tax=Bradyrhizobium daqingense TaxID=993502 RepID=A0A562KZA6_9BRAD|nr:hypothetical protein IQ17_04696 [Bradyrhizobium daqingense]
MPLPAFSIPLPSGRSSPPPGCQSAMRAPISEMARIERRTNDPTLFVEGLIAIRPKLI